MTSEFIVVRTEVEMLIWFDNRSVHAYVWVIVRSNSYFFFSGKTLARLLLLHEEGPELCLESYPKTQMPCCGRYTKYSSHMAAVEGRFKVILGWGG